MFEWSADPEIFSIGFISIRWYSVMFMITFLIGILIFKWIYKREHKPEQELDQLLLYMLIATIVGARLGHCLFYDPGYYLSNPLKILKIWEGGLASHGAAIGILFALYIFAKKRGYSYLWIVDRMVITIALAGFFIRVGNFFNSEIIGEPTTVPWAVIFTNVDMEPRHPAQLYEAFAYLLIFLLLFRIYHKKGEKTEKGWLLGWFLIGVFGFRIFVERFKENQVEFEEGMFLNMGQLLSIPLVIAGIVLVARVIPGRKRRMYS